MNQCEEYHATLYPRSKDHSTDILSSKTIIAQKSQQLHPSLFFVSASWKQNLSSSETLENDVYVEPELAKPIMISAQTP